MLSAGAQCVVTMMWSLPNKAMDKFYYHFYKCLQQGNYVTGAVTLASRMIRKDDRLLSCYINLLRLIFSQQEVNV